MYLDYDEYVKMGGGLDASAFAQFERRAAYEINAQAAGQTGKRIARLDELPQAVKDCVFDLVQFLHNNNNFEKTLTTEIQVSGGVSEHYFYKVPDDNQIKSETDDIIYNTFYGGGIGNLLYRGLLPDDV